ncbi:DUF2235 domain-containing protein [Bosea sp. WAO]|uniref:phospholipase effector Tle1 domain-containing protein n=1 Tax=Bosea sp. WAO TaxID=406341 RepID=UPI0009F815D4|nr:DUF2235 domain-containing protein [Bosea sp. WAO]
MKHIISMIDGTSRNARVEKIYSNIYRLNLALRERCWNDRTHRFDDQVVIYYPGVGTSLTKDRLESQLYGYGIVDLVKDAYVNIASNYYRGDKIYLFGFSRGAVAARILSSFIGEFGLLRPDHIDLLEYAWEYYELTSSTAGPPVTFEAWAEDKYRGKVKILQNVRLADILHDNVHIEFLGLFDAVPGGSNPERSMVRDFRVGNLAPARGVKVAVHLLSIDETRPVFRPVLWNKRSWAPGDFEQTVEQIWMPGVHTDVGGGYPDSFLSNLSLLTMIDKMMQYGLKLQFYDDYIKNIKNETIDKNFSYVINDESSIPYFIREKMVGNIYKYREIGFTNKNLMKDFENDVSGFYNTVHPFVFKIYGKSIIYKNRKRLYMPKNMADISRNECFLTTFYDDDSMNKFCGIAAAK